MGGTICVPQRTGLIIVPSTCVVYLTVGSHIGSVNIVEQCRSNHGMVECRIECGLLGRCTAFNLYLAQFTVPLLLSLIAIIIEVIVRSLCCKVLCCTLLSCCRQCCDKCQLRRSFSSKHYTCHITIACHMSILSLQLGTFELDILYRLRETCAEPDTLITCPTVRKAITLNSTLVYLRYLGVFGSVPVHRLRKIKDNHTLAPVLWKRVTLNSTSRCCC